MSVEIFKTLANVYEHLQDDESRNIFRLKAMSSLTGDSSYYDEYIKTLSERNFLDAAPKDKAYIFGCGCYGKVTFDVLKKDWQAFVDNNEKLYRGGYKELKIIPPKDLPKDATVYISVKWHYDEIKSQLLSYGIKESNIVNMGQILIDMANRQYFDLPEFPHDKNEVFADVGCLNGDTSRNFIKWANGEYKHIYCFEPDPKNANDCRENLKDLADLDKVTIIENAVAEKEGVVSFCNLSNGNSGIGDGEMTVKTVTLDRTLAGKGVTFLKMDVEGGEYNALLGAKELISKEHPKLALSVYHLPQDIYDIPAMILDYYPNYKFYLRHYCPFDYETVLYAF